MPFLNIPPMKRYPPGADCETRNRMYWEYVNRLVDMNPSCFLPRGVRKRWWHFFKIEHPATAIDLSPFDNFMPAPSSRAPDTRQSLRASGLMG